ISLAAAATERVRLGTGIVNVYTRGRALLAQTAAALADLSGGRFVLGIGASSNVIVEQWNAIPFERPLARVRETVEYLRTAFAGERADGRFRLNPPPAEPIPIVVAALRDRKRALELAPESLVREIFLLGPPEAQRERLDEFVAAGITTPILSLACPPEELPAAIAALAPR